MCSFFFLDDWKSSKNTYQIESNSCYITKPSVYQMESNNCYSSNKPPTHQMRCCSPTQNGDTVEHGERLKEPVYEELQITPPVVSFAEHGEQPKEPLYEELIIPPVVNKSEAKGSLVTE